MKLERSPAGFELRVVTTTAHDLDLQVTSEEKLCVFLSYCPGRIPRATPSTLEVSCEKNSGCHCRDFLETEGLKPRQRAGSVTVTDQTDFAQSFCEPAWKLRPLQDIAAEDRSHQESVHCSGRTLFLASLLHLAHNSCLPVACVATGLLFSLGSSGGRACFPLPPLLKLHQERSYLRHPRGVDN